MKRIRLFLSLAAFATVVSAIASTAVPGPGYVYHFDTIINGFSPGSTNRPWLDAIFQNASPGAVRLIVTNLHLTGNEDIEGLYFNLNPKLDPARLRFSVAGGSGGFDAPKISLGANHFRVERDGRYDVLFSFNSGGSPANWLTAGEYLSYNISGIRNLTASDFAWQSAPSGGAGPFYAAAEIERVGDCSLEGWIASAQAAPLVPVPEPGARLLLPLAFAVWFGSLLYRRCWKASSLAGRLQPTPILVPSRCLPRHPTRTSPPPGRQR